MKIILSPSKKLNFTSPSTKTAAEVVAVFNKNFPKYSNYFFTKQTHSLVKIIKKLSIEEFAEQFSLSNNLAALNHKRFQSFIPTSKRSSSPNNSLITQSNPKREAIFFFDGDVYSGLSVNDLKHKELNFLANNLYILSGLYGLLFPLTKIQPYRLEMGKTLPNKKSLYEFWGDSIARFLLKSMQKSEPLVNLASEEYFNSVSPYLKNQPLVTPVFKDLPNSAATEKLNFIATYTTGKHKVISFYAKKARGLFAKFIAMNYDKVSNIKNINELCEFFQTFNLEGYFFDNEKQTKHRHVLTFLRNK